LSDVELAEGCVESRRWTSVCRIWW